MKAKVVPASSEATLLCPTDFCWDLETQCIIEGNNHDFFPYTTVIATCVDDDNQTWDFAYVECCRLPGCTELIWRDYCRQ